MIRNCADSPLEIRDTLIGVSARMKEPSSDLGIKGSTEDRYHFGTSITLDTSSVIEGNCPEFL